MGESEVGAGRMEKFGREGPAGDVVSGTGFWIAIVAELAGYT